MKFESGLCIAFVDQTYPEILASTNNSKICISSSRHKSLETYMYILWILFINDVAWQCV